MADIVLGGTVSPGGPFEQARQQNIKGGLHAVADVTARDALPAYLREEGMFVWVITPGAMYQLRGGILNANWATVGDAPRVSYDMLNAERTTGALTTTPEVVGAVYFDPNTIIPTSSGRTRHVTMEVLIESASGLYNAVFDIYDVNGISTGGTPGVVTNSTKQTTNLGATRFTQNLDAVLGSITTAGILEGRLAVQTPGPGYATCKLARLIVTWD